MEDCSPPTSRDELVAYVAEFVKEKHALTGRSTSGAFLASSIRHEFPELNLQAIGLSRLVDVVTLAEERGLVVRDRSVQHLEISPPGTGSGDTGGRPPRVRREVWKAVVFVSQRYATILNKKTGKIRTELRVNTSGEAKNLDESIDWLRIEAICADTQKRWMHQFISEHSTLSSVEVPTDDERWWEVFSERLRVRSSQDEYAWRCYRTERVVKFLSNWADLNSVPLRFLLMVPPTVSKRGVAASPPPDEQALRQAILAAIAEMPLEQLKQVAIPVQYIMRHFTVR